MRIRENLSYANVMATIAVFIALGGGAYAAVNLPKGSVGAKQLKKKAVRTAKIAGGAVTGAKVAPDTLTGTAIDESTLGTVPNASRVGGSEVRQISWRVPAGTTTQTLFTAGGLTVKANCPAGQDFVNVAAESSVDESILGIGAVKNIPVYNEPTAGDTLMPGVDNVFEAGEQSLFQLDDTATVLSYGRGPSGSPVVTATFLANSHTVTGICSVVGTVVSSG
jgi:hypothetical protein